MTNAERLQAWLVTVLPSGSLEEEIELEDGRRADVRVEDGCVLAYTHDEEENPVFHARIRFVSENPAED